jgi:uncharacterized protein (DUF3084 family)
MSWQNILALAVFVGVCGLIAYVGDITGRRMGKRRLSLFGLRPRHTAIVTTSITGMLIAIFTIAVMSAASKEVQQLVLHGAQVLEDLRNTQKAYATASHELGRQKTIVVLARKQTALAVQQRHRLAVEISRIDATLRRLRADLQRNKATLTRTEQTLSQAQGNLALAKVEVAAKRTQITEQEAAISKLEANRQELQRGLESYKKSYSELRGGKIILHPNQDIARRVISSAQPKAKIRVELMKLLDEASEKAKQEGAKTGPNGRTVHFLPTQFEGQNHVYVESEILSAIADSIYSGSGTVVARIYARGNSFEGEQAAIDCELRANRLVYLTGDEVAGTVIDGTQSNGKIFSDLVVFLQTEVRSAAMYKGIVPTLDENGQPSVGQINNWDQVFDLVLHIKAANKRMRVTAQAARETWSAGPLPVDFKVGDAK